MTQATLYDIDADYTRIANMLDDREGDITGIEVWLDEYLDALDEKRDEKVDGYCAIIRELQERAAGRAAEAKRLAALVQTDTNHANKLKERLKQFFERRGVKKLQTARFALSVCKNGGKQPLTVDLAADELPRQYQRIMTEINKDAIAEALSGGMDLEYARFEPRGTHLRIR